MYIGCINFILLCIKCHLEDGILSLTYVGEFMFIGNLLVYINCLPLLLCINDYNQRTE